MYFILTKRTKTIRNTGYLTTSLYITQGDLFTLSKI